MKDTVLITGAAGFIGHHVMKHILDNTDFNVVSLDRLDTAGTLDRIAEIIQYHPEYKERIKVVWHDLKAAISKYTSTSIGPVKYILHIAASSHVDRSIADPMSFILDNVVGTCNILEYARTQDDLKMFINFGTDEVFGPAPSGTLFKDDDRYNSCNPYSASKAGGEELCVAYYNTYKLPIVMTHTMNVYGIRQDPEKFIPLVIRKLLRDETVDIHTNSAKQVTSRHYLHVEDVGRAMHHFMFHADIGQKYNIVANDEKDNLELALSIAALMGKTLDYRLIDPSFNRPGCDFRYACCGKKSLNNGWEPKIPMTEGLKQVVDWMVINKRWLHL